MSVLNSLVTLAVVGFLLRAVNTYLPMDAKIRSILNVVVVVLVVVWILRGTGLQDGLGSITVGG